MRQSRNRLTEVQREEITARYQAGETAEALSEAYGITVRHARSMGTGHRGRMCKGVGCVRQRKDETAFLTDLEKARTLIEERDWAAKHKLPFDKHHEIADLIVSGNKKCQSQAGARYVS